MPTNDLKLNELIYTTFEKYASGDKDEEKLYLVELSDALVDTINDQVIAGNKSFTGSYTKVTKLRTNTIANALGDTELTFLELKDAYDKRHTHSNKSALDTITTELLQSIITESDLSGDITEQSTVTQPASRKNVYDLAASIVDAMVNKTTSQEISGAKTFKQSVFIDSPTPFVIGKNGKGGFRAVNGYNAQVGQMNISDGWYQAVEGKKRYGVQISALDEVENKHNQIRVSHNGPQYIQYNNITGTETIKNLLIEGDNKFVIFDYDDLDVSEISEAYANGKVMFVTKKDEFDTELLYSLSGAYSSNGDTTYDYFMFSYLETYGQIIIARNIIVQSNGSDGTDVTSFENTTKVVSANDINKWNNYDNSIFRRIDVGNSYIAVRNTASQTKQVLLSGDGFKYTIDKDASTSSNDPIYGSCIYVNSAGEVVVRTVRYPYDADSSHINNYTIKETVVSGFEYVVYDDSLSGNTISGILNKGKLPVLNANSNMYMLTSIMDDGEINYTFTNIKSNGKISTIKIEYNNNEENEYEFLTLDTLPTWNGGNQ